MWNNWEKMKEKLYNVSMIFMGLLAAVCLLGMANGAKEVDIVSGTIMVILTDGKRREARVIGLFFLFFRKIKMPFYRKPR